MASSESSLLYLEKDRLFFYDGEKISKMDFTPSVVRDLDVLNEDALISLVFQFIDTGKLAPSAFLFVLSESVLFSEEITETDQNRLNVAYQTFMDQVPFDYILAKQFKTDRGARLLATNAELINTISDSFAQKGFTKDGVVPAMVYGQFGVRRGLDLDTANYMLKNQEMAKGKSLTAEEVPTEFAVTPAKQTTFKIAGTGKNTTLPYLIGGFVILLLVLLALIFLRK